jgi:hypothetical protein
MRLDRSSLRLRRIVLLLVVLAFWVPVLRYAGRNAVQPVFKLAGPGSSVCVQIAKRQGGRLTLKSRPGPKREEASPAIG